MSVNQDITSVADPVVEESGDLVKLVDQVVESHAPVIVARDGTPIAALVSMEDYARLKREASNSEKKLSWEEWSREACELRQDILAYRDNTPVDLDKLIRENHDELEERDAYNSGAGR